MKNEIFRFAHYGLFCISISVLVLTGCNPDSEEAANDVEQPARGIDSPAPPQSNAPAPETCGNGRIDGDEVCDGTNLGDKTCESLGFEGGQLTCYPNCMALNTSACNRGSSALDPGSECNCSSDCRGNDTNPGICVFGVCMQEASSACSEPASQAECPHGSKCWGMAGTTYHLCFPDCDTYSCAGVCDDSGTCTVATSDTSCDGTCSPLCVNSSGNEDWGTGPATDGSVGSMCETDADCSADAPDCINDYPGLINPMVGGYCTVRNCGQDDCPSGSTCLSIEGTDLSMCLDRCASSADCRQGYSCFGGTNTCFPNGDGGGGFRCNGDADCAGSEICAHSGACVEFIDTTMVPMTPVPDCGSQQGIPAIRTCDQDGQPSCSELIQFDPPQAHGYWDYEINQEGTNGSRSWVRRDVMELVRYATASTQCLSADWAFGNQQPLGLGDMSEANGAIPGTAIGYPGHPEGSHTNGYDMDIAYYQLGTVDNKLRSVCEFEVDGVDQSHCSGRVDTLDIWRTALFIGKLHDSEYLRVIGVDGKVGPLVVEAMDELCRLGWLEGNACENPRLAYEETNQNYGWFYWHHHHLHLSVSGYPISNFWSSIWPNHPQHKGTCYAPPAP